VYQDKNVYMRYGFVLAPVSSIWNCSDGVVVFVVHFIIANIYFDSDMSKSTNTVVYPLIGRRLFIFTFAEYVAHNLCCQIRAVDNSWTCTLTTGKSITCTGTCANEFIPNR